MFFSALVALSSLPFRHPQTSSTRSHAAGQATSQAISKCRPSKRAVAFGASQTISAAQTCPQPSFLSQR